MNRCRCTALQPVAVVALVCCAAQLQIAGFAHTCSAATSLNAPTASVYVAPQDGAASVPFSTSSSETVIQGSPSDRYVVSWYMTLRCTTNLGGHVAYADTDWAGECPATPDASGRWEHYAHGAYPGVLQGNLSLSAGSYYARSECSFSGFLVGDENHNVGASATPSSKHFDVVNEAPPGGGGEGDA